MEEKTNLQELIGDASVSVHRLEMVMRDFSRRESILEKSELIMYADLLSEVKTDLQSCLCFIKKEAASDD